MTIAFDHFSSSLRNTVSITDRVAEFLRGMILSGEWRPGDRIVETQIAKRLGIGQPTVREALGKLEEAGLVQQHLNRGCVVTQLSQQDFNQMFRVRIELECLAVELATENRDERTEAKLSLAFSKFEEAARKSKVEEYYRADFEFHQAIWQLTGNRFLEKALTQVVIPLFNFAILGRLKWKNLDFVLDAKEHIQLIEVILNGDKDTARRVARSVFAEFWHQGLTIVPEYEGVPTLPPKLPREPVAP